MFKILGKREKVGFGGCWKLKYEVNKLVDSYNVQN